MILLTLDRGDYFSFQKNQLKGDIYSIVMSQELSLGNIYHIQMNTTRTKSGDMEKLLESMPNQKAADITTKYKINFGFLSGK